MDVRVSQRETSHCLWVSEGFVDQTPETPKRRRPPTGALRAAAAAEMLPVTHEVGSDGEVPTYEVEAIVGERARQGLTEFKVRWEGYSPSDDTWEPFENLENCTVFQQHWATKTVAVSPPRRQSPNTGGRSAPQSRGKSGGASSTTVQAGESRALGGAGSSQGTRAPAVLSAPLKCQIPTSRRGPRGELWRELAQGGFKRRVDHPSAATPTRPANISGSRYASGRRLLMAITNHAQQREEERQHQPEKCFLWARPNNGCRGNCPTNCMCFPSPAAADAGVRPQHCAGRCHPTNCVCCPPQQVGRNE